jgi:transcriptional regulator of acetoin/glycerol metabolism
MTSSESGSIEQARRERFASSKKLYSEAINQAGGDVELAAQRLGMSRATLYRRLRKYGLTEDVSQIRHNIRREKNRA